MKKKIAIIGLGYVGLPLAFAFAKKNKVIGFDIDKFRIRNLKKFNDTTLQFEKHELLSIKNNLTYSYCISDIKKCEIFIITVPTPIDNNNLPDLSYLIDASKMIGSILKINDLVVYESTVYPGVTENICVPELEKSSGLKFNKHFFCGYSPERINPGDKINSLQSIKKIISGSTPEVTHEVEKLYKTIITAGTFKASSIRVAEAAKVIENVQRDINIALINELSMIFERLNLDTSEVLDAASSKWNFVRYRPGLVGGHCISVDPYYLSHASEQVNYSPRLIMTGRAINNSMAVYLVKKVIQKMILNGINVGNSTIGVLGITFKENCPDIRNTKIVEVVEELSNWGVNVIVHDPYADKEKVKEKFNIELNEINKDKKFDSIIVAVSHDKYRSMSGEYLRSLCRGPNPVIADVKSIYKKADLIKNGFSVFRL